MRGEVVRLASGAMVVNDCYNSNPDALEQMLTAVHAIPARRRFAVLGGMMELGPSSQILHHQCGRRVAELGFDGLFTVGDLASGFAEGAREAGMAERAVSQFVRFYSACFPPGSWKSLGGFAPRVGRRAAP